MLGYPPVSDLDLAHKAEAEFDLGVAAREKNERSSRHFLAAALAYEELRQRGVRSADLERSAGNAYLLGGDLPRAILAYRRGLRLAPDDRRLRDNIAEAREHAPPPEGSTLGRPPDERPTWLPHVPRSLFAVAVAGYVVFCLALARWFMLWRSLALSVALGGLLVAIAATALLVVTLRAESSRPVVVIATNGVQLRKGDGWGFQPRYETPVNKGAEARLLYRSESGWLQVELAGGEIGWVAQSEAVVEDD